MNVSQCCFETTIWDSIRLYHQNFATDFRLMLGYGAALPFERFHKRLFKPGVQPNIDNGYLRSHCFCFGVGGVELRNLHKPLVKRVHVCNRFGCLQFVIGKFLLERLPACEHVLCLHFIKNNLLEKRDPACICRCFAWRCGLKSRRERV